MKQRYHIPSSPKKLPRSFRYSNVNLREMNSFLMQTLVLSCLRNNWLFRHIQTVRQELLINWTAKVNFFKLVLFIPVRKMYDFKKFKIKKKEKNREFSSYLNLFSHVSRRPWIDGVPVRRIRICVVSSEFRLVH